MKITFITISFLLSNWASLAAGQPQVLAKSPVSFVNWGFENASPLQWDIADDGVLHVHLLYDYERSSPNRAAGHWHFQVVGTPGARVTVQLHDFDNIYNGKIGSPVSARSICFISADGKSWTTVPAELLEGNVLRVRLTLDERTGSLYLARLEPYRLSDLERLKNEIQGNSLVQITEIGKTVEGRLLEIIRVGKPDAPHRVFLRGRAHAWETAGNWITQGLIRSLLEDDPVSKQFLERICLYVMPMANKDGVARGLTRFNLQGKDLNRDWMSPADPRLMPENAALESWIEHMTRQGTPIHLLLDLHNDESGNLHISRPPSQSADRYLERVKVLEQMLRKDTFFTEGTAHSATNTTGTIGDGLVERFGIDAHILEFNCNRIAGRNGQPPSGASWELFGKQLRAAFLDYFAEVK